MSQEILTWVNIFSLALGTVTAVVIAFWAYIKYVVEQGVFPSAKLNVDLNVIGQQSKHYLLELIILSRTKAQHH